MSELKRKSPAWAYLYILGCPDGPHKIGYSYCPKARAKAMVREGTPGVYVAGEWPVGALIAQAAERYVHWALRDKHLKNEWFNVERDEAEAAIKRALRPEILASLDRCNLIPPLTAPNKGLRHLEYVRSHFVSGTKERIVTALEANETQADFVRKAVESELERRERSSETDLGTPPHSPFPRAAGSAPGTTSVGNAARRPQHGE